MKSKNIKELLKLKKNNDTNTEKDRINNQKSINVDYLTKDKEFYLHRC